MTPILKTHTPKPKPVHRRTVQLFRVRYQINGTEDLWSATDGEGYQEFVQAGTRYEAALRLGILDLLKRSA